jgi:aryl-alcohol dehydrogenase-like predicted oxidoreductase
MMMMMKLFLLLAISIYINALTIPKVKLGSSDLMISKITLGTMTFGQQNTEAEAHEQLNVAFNEYGINMLDTAEIYPVPTKENTQGLTDQYIASWLKNRKRGDVIIATKVAGASPNLKYMPGRNGGQTRVSKEQIKTSVDFSLKRLGTDYIDLIQIHWPDRYVPMFGADGYKRELERNDAISFQEQLEAVDELIKAGKVRYLGVSNETPYGAMKFCELARSSNLPKICSIQNSYSMLTRSEFESGGLAEVCSPLNEDIGLLPYSPLAGGILTGKYLRSDCPGARLNLFEGYMTRYKQSLAKDAVNKYCEIADKYNLTPTELSLAWVYSRSHVTSTIIGATSLTQLKENIEAYGKIDKISDSVIEDIQSVYKVYRDPSKI